MDNSSFCQIYRNDYSNDNFIYNQASTYNQTSTLTIKITKSKYKTLESLLSIEDLHLAKSYNQCRAIWYNFNFVF